MEDHIQKFIDLLGEYKADLENQLLNNMLACSLPEDGSKETVLRAISKFNKHGVPTKVLCEVCAELVKEGAFK